MKTRQIKKERSILGDSVPKPLGFNAFVPSHAREEKNRWGRGLRPAPAWSSPGVGAQVASLRCPILRSGQTQYSGNKSITTDAPFTQNA